MEQVHLLRKLVLEAPDKVSDGAGGFIESWTTRGVVWADMKARTGRGRDGGEVSLARMAYRIVVRAAPQGAVSRPVPGMRFREGLRIYLIEAVAERDPQGRYLTCFASEEVVV